MLLAAATCGLEGLLHRPKGMMFTIDSLSKTVAIGFLDALTL
jgi:hypothetical protein